ncbi:MAG: hypothetical protein ACOYNB_05770 [Aquabacterium sp.]|uniref:hypothetical protein n=1 Tax=Aquabacterium sp. TaxID=1872578 RepID=UPI003BDC36B6
MATRSSHPNGAVAAKLAQQDKHNKAAQQGLINDAHKDAVQAADQAWLNDAQKAWEESRQAEADASAAAQQGDLVVDLVTASHGATVVGESLVDATYPVGDEAAGAAALLNSGSSGAAAGGASAGTAGGIFSGAGGWIAGGLGAAFAAGTVDTGDEIPNLVVISNDHGTAVSADAETPAHYEHIRVLLETETGPYGGVLVDGVNSYDVALLDGSDAVVQFSDKLPADVIVRTEGEYATAYAGLFATGTVNDISVLAGGDHSAARYAMNYVGGIKVMGASTDVSADVAQPVVYLNGGDLTVEATAAYSYAYAYLGGMVSSSGDADPTYTMVGRIDHVDVHASAAGTMAGATVTLDGDITGGITVVASGSADVSTPYNIEYAAARFGARVTGDVTGGVEVSATGEGSYAMAGAYVGGDFSGGIDVVASGAYVVTGEDSQGSRAYGYVLAEGDLHGDVSAHAESERSYAYAFAYAQGNAYGDVSATASGATSRAYAGFYVGGTYSDDVTVTADGEYARAYARFNARPYPGSPDGVLEGSSLAVHATGDYSYAYAYAGAYLSNDTFWLHGTAGSIDAEASGLSSRATVRFNIDGDVAGDIHVMATGDNSSAVFGEDFAQRHVHIAGDVVGDVTIAATGTNSFAYSWTDVGHDVQGDVSITAYNGSYAGLKMSAENVQDIHITAGSGDTTGMVVVSLDVDQYYDNGTTEVASHVGSVSVTGDVGSSVSVSFADRFANDIHLGTDATAYDGNFSLSLGVADDLLDKDATDWSSALDTTVTSEDTAFLKDHMITIDGFADGLGADSITFSHADFASAIYEDGGSFDTIASFLASADAALDTVGVYFGAVDTNGDHVADTGFLAVDGDHSGISYVIRFTDLTEFEQGYVTNSVPVNL